MDVSVFVSRAIVLLVAVVVHEFAHAYAAFTQGDTTARDTGRMTLDPRANVYWPGYLIGVLVGFAVLGSAPVNPYRMRDPRRGMFIAVLAGPVSNLILAALFAVPFRFGVLHPSTFGSISGLLPTPERLLTDMVALNVLLFFFNLVPLFPLDGWTVVLSLLPARPALWWQRHQRESMYALYGLILLTVLSGYLGLLALINPLTWLVGVPSDLVTRVLTGG
jgi:Zn-dependent protease